MNKIVFSILMALIFNSVTAQSNCPNGYVERNVRCDGKTTVICVPQNFSCDDCWHVNYSDCNGKVEGSMWGGSYDSYEECLAKAQEFKKNHSFLGNCPEAGNKYIIYLLGSRAKLCNRSVESNSLINDLKNKINPFATRYLMEIKNFRDFIINNPVKPGATFIEYTTGNLGQMAEDVHRLQEKINSVNSENLSQIENIFSNMQNDEQKLMNAYSAYSDQVNSDKQETQKKLQEESIRKNTEARQRNLQQLQTTQNQITQINQNYQNQSKTITDAIETGGNELMDIMKRKQSKEAAAEEAREKREYQKREREAERRREEAERQTTYEEEQRQREIAEKSERERQWNNDLKIIGGNGIHKDTSELSHSAAVAYYIVYERNYSTGKVNIKTYSLNKYSDDTWMLKNDFLKKINFEPYFGNSGSGILLGAYESKQTAMQVLNQIRSMSSDANVQSDFLSLTDGQPVNQNEDFWKN